MIFECQLLQQCLDLWSIKDVTIMLLQTPNGNGYMGVYENKTGGVSGLVVYEVVWGKMTIENVDERKWKSQPNGVLCINGRGKQSEYFMNHASGGYNFVKSSNRNFQIDFSNFTPIEEINLSTLNHLYPKLIIENIHYTKSAISLPTMISNKVSYDAITKLTLYGNNLSSIPKEVCYFKNLEALHLDINKICEIKEDVFGADSRLITTLKVLTLSENQIKKLPLSLFKLKNLRGINLNFNMIKYIPNEIGNLSKLKDLYINGNQLTCVPAGISKLSDLKHWHMHDNPLSEIDDQETHVMPENENIPSLYHMCLNAVYKNKLLSDKIPPILKLTSRYEDRKTCLCGDKVFNESRNHLVKISRSIFQPQTFPVEVVSCSNRCYEEQMSILTNWKL